jgi:hypothetical protein
MNTAGSLCKGISPGRTGLFIAEISRMHSPPRPTATSGMDECSRVFSATKQLEAIMNTTPRNREADALLLRTCFSNAELYGLACVFVPVVKRRRVRPCKQH